MSWRVKCKNELKLNRDSSVHTIKDALIDFSTAGQQNRLGGIPERNIQLAVLYSLTGIVQFLLFAFYFLKTGHGYHSLSLFLFAVFLTLAYCYLRVTGNHRRYFDMVISMMSLFCLYMVCLGGAHSSGPLWTYFIPLLASYLQGLKKGFFTITALLAMILIIFYGPWTSVGIASYPPIFKVRFLGSLTMVCIMAFTYEYSRKIAHKELVTLSERLDRVARTDELTGLSNRRDMKEKLLYETNRMTTTRKPFCLLLADIDDFKQVNDNHGHDAGDLILQAVSRVMQAALRKKDVISRWGGEEFLMLLPETSITEGRNTANRLLRQITGQPFPIQKTVLTLSVSIGLAQYTPPEDLEKAITKADRALYRAKSKGKCRIESV